jgi:hypothetical protein
MPPRRTTRSRRQPTSLPRRRARGDRAAIDSQQPDGLDRTEVALQWIETLGDQFKRIAALQADIDLPRAKKNGN